MSTQSYANHAHQPVFTLVASGFWMVAVLGFGAAWRGAPWGAPLGVAALLAAVFCLISITRVYTTRLQDRIIVVEELLRAERLLPPAALAQWKALGVKQVVALRFAADGEFPTLTARAASESMTPDAIKRAITQWRADHRRT